MSAGFTFHASCPRCGGELLTDGYEPAVEAPERGYHDARCDRCLDVLRITVSVSVVEPWPVDRLDPEARRKESAGQAALMLATSGLK